VGVEIYPLDLIARDEFLDIDRPSRFQLDRFQADTLLSDNLTGDANFRSMRKPEVTFR
jgi:hypothetical protein